MEYSIAVFDLDGTLVDSSDGITNSVAYALDKNGVPHGDKQTLKHFIGPPLREEFMKTVGVSEEEGGRFVNDYREYYSDRGIFECSLYDGVTELLERLRECGYKILLATSKPEKYAKMILEHFGIAEYFDYAGGANFDNTRTDKASVIEYSLKSAGLYGDRQNAVMVGDHANDIIGANAHEIDSVFVTYGFGEKSTALAHNPTHICESATELSRLLTD